MNTESPYTAPEAIITKNLPLDYNFAGPRKVAFERCLSWISEGFSLFKNSPWQWIALVLLGLLTAFAILIIPLIGAIFVFISTYIWVGGIMLGCYEQSKGNSFSVSSLFWGFKNHFGSLMLLTIILFLLNVLIMGISMGPFYYDIYMSALEGKTVSPQIDASFLWSYLIAIILTFPVLMMSFFSPSLIVINEKGVLQAMALSFRGSVKNIGALIVFGILAFFLYIAALIPVFLGLFVFIPVMFGAVFSAYKDVFLEGVAIQDGNHVQE